MMFTSQLKAQRVRELFDYDPETGIMLWKTKSSKYMGTAQVGDPAGTPQKGGHLSIRIDGRKYLAHRIAWLHVHGTLVNQIDHRDGNRTNNRLDNLRPATNGQNRANAKLGRNSSSGFKGVYWRKKKNKWEAKISVNKKSIHLGTFSSAEEAHAAYVRAAQERFGEFARAA